MILLMILFLNDLYLLFLFNNLEEQEGNQVICKNIIVKRLFMIPKSQSVFVNDIFQVHFILFLIFFIFIDFLLLMNIFFYPFLLTMNPKISIQHLKFQNVKKLRKLKSKLSKKIKLGLLLYYV